MSHPFSSTLDALQAHFAKKTSPAAPGQPGSQDAPASGGQSRAPEPGSAPAVPAPGRDPGPFLAQNAPSTPLAALPVNELPGRPRESLGMPQNKSAPVSLPDSEGLKRMSFSPQINPQQYTFRMHTERPPLSFQAPGPAQASLGHGGPGLALTEGSHGLRNQNVPSAGSSDARSIAQAASDFMKGASAAVPGLRSDVPSGSTRPTAPSEMLETANQVMPVDTETDSLLRRQNALIRQEAAEGDGSQSEEQDSDALDDAEQHVLADFEGGPRKRAKKNTQYSEGGSRGSGQPSSRGRGRTKQKRGPRRAAEPTGDVKLRLNMASEAYVQGRVGDAIKLVEDAIRINAEIHRAWVLLAQLFEEQGDLKKRLTALICASQLEPKNIEGWLSVAQSAVALRDVYPDDAEELTRQAILCYSCALRADVEHQAARHSRAALCLDRGQYKGAAKDYLFLVNRKFYDIYALRGLAETSVLLAETSKRKQTSFTPEEAIAAYRKCIAHFRENGIDPDYPFDWEDLYVFVDLLGYIGHYGEAIHELKSVARWMLERSDEPFWDHEDGIAHDNDDDREWDANDSRRLEVPGFQAGRHPDTSYGNGLPLQLRTKLGAYRLELGHEDEAMVSYKATRVISS